MPPGLLRWLCGIALVISASHAKAQCALPFTLANGQPADAAKLMANFNAIAGCIAPGGSTNAIQYNTGSGLGGVGPLSNGQLFIGSTGNPPAAQTLTAGSGIAIANGPGSITISATVPGPAGLYHQMMSATPTSASTGLTTWLNQGSSAVADSAVGVAMNSPSSGSTINIAGRFKPAPTAPYTITALIAATRNSASGAAVGLGWYDGAAKLHLLGYAVSGTTPILLVQRWNSTSSLNSTDFTSASNAFAQPIWMRIKDDGTNVSFAFSHDGASFLTVYSVAKSSGFLGASGYNNVIFFNDPRGGQTIGTLMSWTQE